MPDRTEPATIVSGLVRFYEAQFQRLQAQFDAGGDGLECIRDRAAVVDSVISRLYAALFTPDQQAVEDFCLVATGGYGRQELFPYSDVDLLFAFTNSSALSSRHEAVAAFVRCLWDTRMRVGHSSRTIEECGQLHPGNLEFNVSLLDLRHLAGSLSLFAELRDRTLPRLVARDQQPLIRNLIDLTRQRHAKYGDTVFQLEPNVKDAPGGLRDYQVARWLSFIGAVAARRSWPQSEDAWTGPPVQRLGEAKQFLAAVRCCLHFQRGRDDNLLTYDLQEKAAALGLGAGDGEALRPAPWMKSYFRHTRSINGALERIIDDAIYPQSSLYGLFQDWRSRLSNSQFSVIRGKIFPRSPGSSPQALGSILEMFEMVARHELELSREAETWVEEVLRKESNESGGDGQAASTPSPLPAAGAWPVLRRILVLPGAAQALRAMHRVGLLEALFPEFKAIDALVIHDFYHHYTVDEHSFMTIQNLGELRPRRGKRDPGALGQSSLIGTELLSAIYSEVEQPELLSLALLFHDVGKGMEAPDHVQGGLQAARSVCARLGIGSPETETVLFLIARHLEMSSTIARRDIFDPETIRSFAEAVGTPERLKMLCLLTYADIRAVGPEALTPWKAETLCQLYTMTSNYFSRSLDLDRLAPAQEESAKITQVLSFVGQGITPGQLNSFLDGFPKRYLETRSAEEVARHFEMARQIHHSPVQVQVFRRRNYNELIVITSDRPHLFASIAGTLAGWGMNILKADAFGNRSGIVLDVLRFHDLHRTLELNPQEISRLEKSVTDVLAGRLALEALLAGRFDRQRPRPAKLKIATHITFNDAASSRSTLLELVTQDYPGLLYQLSSTLAELGSNIEVALIDTEAEKAIDVFYLTEGGHKLGKERQEEIRLSLLNRLAERF